MFELFRTVSTYYLITQVGHLYLNAVSPQTSHFIDILASRQ